MLFNSWEFAVFFVVVYAAYLLLSGVKTQNLLLLFASYFFYASWDWRFLSLILISTAVDFVCGAKIHSSRSRRIRRLLVIMSITTNLGILGFFKYFDFFVGSLQVLLEGIGIDSGALRLGVILPVGISFYTFQTLSYTIDIYRDKLEPSRDLVEFALFVAFFPQLVAGPIERARNLLPQLRSPRFLTRERLQLALWLVFWGLWKKVFVADNLAYFVDDVFERSVEVTALYAYLGIVAFAFQIYCDFSAYSDIARGTAKLLGIDLMRNFNLPYFARNPSDFWRRWHISLSTWLRDFLYIPLGGSRGSNLATYRNLLLTMVLGGLWHGASWNFVWWGLFHGAILAVHRFFRGSSTRSSSKLRGVLSIAAMSQFTLFGWLLFRSTRRIEVGGQIIDDSFRQILEMLTTFRNGWGFDVVTAGLASDILFFVTPLLAVELLQHFRNDHYIVLRWPWQLRSSFFALLLFTWILWGVQRGEAFIYFQF